MAIKRNNQQLVDEEYKFGFKDKIDYPFVSEKQLTSQLVEKISNMKEEPLWMKEFRLKGLHLFNKKAIPDWGNTELLHSIDFNNIHYYIKPSDKLSQNWDEVPDDIKNTFDRLGIPEAERKFLAGVTAQYESEVVYHSIRKEIEDQGVVFTDMDSGLKDHEEIVKQYIGTVIPIGDNKFSALNSAVWSGGSFVWVPEGVHIDIPLQAYFRINAENMGQFERTLIIAEPNSSVHYIEGCTAPNYTTNSLHSAVVELIALPGSHIRYTTIQNWSDNVYNLVTKRALAKENAQVEWIDGNIGSKLTMKFPCVVLAERGAQGRVLSVAYASDKQHQDTGAKMIHAAPDTKSLIESKSISVRGGRSSYRGLVKILDGAENSRANVRCDALLLDEESRSDTYPTMDINEKTATVEHEATVSKVSDEQLFYLSSRGISEADSIAMIVNGFFEPFAKEVPLEYAVELNRLIKLEMEGSVG